MVIIQQLGCWKFLVQHKKWLWRLIFLKFTRIQIYSGQIKNLAKWYKLKNMLIKNLVMNLSKICGWCVAKFRRNKALIAGLSTPAPGSTDLCFPTKYSTSIFTQCMACLWKQHWSYWRNPPYTAVRFLFTTFIALMFGTMFWDLGSKL